jgi:putative transposase
VPRPKRQLSPDFPFHITSRSIHRHRFPVSMDTAWSIFEDYLFLGHKFYDVRIHSFVLMPNHYHLLVSDPTMQLSKFMWFLQNMASREMIRLGKRINQNWGQRYFSCRIDSNHYFNHAYRYVFRNPVDSKLTNRVEEYRYSTLNGILGQSRLTIPIEADTMLFSNLEATLKWLNTSYENDDRNLLTRGLQKKVFTLPLDRTRRAPHRFTHSLI